MPRSDLAAQIEKTYEASKKTAPPAEPAAPARGPDGKFAPKAQENTQAETPVVPAAEKPPEAIRDAEATAREERALTALRRAKVPKSLLDGMDHDTRIQWGSDLAAEQSKTDKMLRSRGADSETRPDPKAGTPAQADPAQGTPQVAADLSAISAKFADSMALDEDGRQLLEQYGAALRAPLVQQITATNAAIESNRQAAAQTDEMMSAYIAGQVLAGLTNEIPELADKAIARDVRTRMDRLLKPDKHGSTAYDHIEDPMERITEAARDAAAIECRDAIRERAKDATINRNERRGASQPDVSVKRADAGDVGDTPYDYAFALLSKGTKTAREVQQLVDQRFR